MDATRQKNLCKQIKRAIIHELDSLIGSPRCRPVSRLRSPRAQLMGQPRPHLHCVSRGRMSEQSRARERRSWNRNTRHGQLTSQRDRRMLKGSLAVLAAGLCFIASTQAETATYTYDVFERLRKVEVSGGPANAVERTFDYDATDNRTQNQVSGSSNGRSCDTGSIRRRGTVRRRSTRSNANFTGIGDRADGC